MMFLNGVLLLMNEDLKLVRSVDLFFLMMASRMGCLCWLWVMILCTSDIIKQNK